MKKISIFLFALLTPFLCLKAQRFAYVNTEYILNNIPEYADAQKQIDQLSNDWKAEVDRRQKEIDDLYKAFQNEQYLLTEDQKQARIKEIEDKESALKDYQKQKFGYDGELYKKREELVKPIQDKVYAAIQKLAQDRGYDFIFDKASGTTILYADDKNDRSDDILRAMGYTPQQNK